MSREKRTIYSKFYLSTKLNYFHKQKIIFIFDFSNVILYHK